MTQEEAFASHWPEIKEAFAEWEKKWNEYNASCAVKWNWSQKDYRAKEAASFALYKLLFNAASKAFYLPQHSVAPTNLLSSSAGDLVSESRV